MAEGGDLNEIFGDAERVATSSAASFNPLLPPHMATPDEVAQVVDVPVARLRRARSPGT